MIARRVGVRAFAHVIFVGMLMLGISSASAQLTWQQREVAVRMAASQKDAVVRFPFNNSGSKPVQIKAIRSLCSCTTVSLTKKEFAPGESGEIVATYTPGQRIGTQRNLITVETDDVTEKQAVLCVVAEIPVVMKLERPFLLWKENEEPATKSLAIAIGGEEPVDAIVASAADPNIRVVVEKVEAGQFRLNVTPKPGASVSTTVMLEATVGGNQKKRLNAFVRVR